MQFTVVEFRKENSLAVQLRLRQFQGYVVDRTHDKWQAYSLREGSEPRLPIANELPEVRSSAETAC